MSKCNPGRQGKFFKCSDKCTQEAHKHRSLEELTKCANKCLETSKEEAEVCEREQREEEAKLREDCYEFCKKPEIKVLKIPCIKNCNQKFGAPEHHPQLDNTLEDNFYYSAAGIDFMPT